MSDEGASPADVAVAALVRARDRILVRTGEDGSRLPGGRVETDDEAVLARARRLAGNATEGEPSFAHVTTVDRLSGAALGDDVDRISGVALADDVDRISGAALDDDADPDYVVPVLLDVAGDERPPVVDDAAWVSPPALREADVAAWCWLAYDAVRPRVATIRDDSEHGASTLSRWALTVLRDEAALAAGPTPSGTDRAASGDDWAALASLARDLRDARPAMVAVRNRVNGAMSAAAGTDPADDSAISSVAAGGDPGAPTPAAAVSTADVQPRSPDALRLAADVAIERARAAVGGAASVAADRLAAPVGTLSRSGTVARALEIAAPEEILVAASWPGREGVGVAETLARRGADGDRPAAENGPAVTLCSDAAFPDLLARADAATLLVGADRVLPDGRVVNKAGTRAAAMAAPPDCTVLVATTTASIATDDAVDREQRAASELYDGDAPLAVDNPTFDVTPAGAIDAICTERGVLDPDDVAAVAGLHRARADWA